MRFLGKYELVEQHTVGTVETFSAHPIGANDLLLVHIFSLPALTKAEPSNRDLLDYLERICPPTLGAVLDGGQYDDGSQAYIITKFPRDPDALESWIEAYKAMPRATAKLAPKSAKPQYEEPDSDFEPGRSRVSPLPPPAEKPAGDFTRMFQSLGAEKPTAMPPATPRAKPPEARPREEWRPEAPSAVRPAEAPHVTRRPAFSDPLDAKPPAARPPAAGSLTEQFAGLGEGAKLPRSASYDEPLLAPPVKNREPDSWVAPEAPKAPPEPSRETSRAGEFTQFFRSPFAAPPPAEPLPTAVPDFVNRPAPGRSDFTQLFGPSSGSLTPLPPEPLLEPPGQSERGSFTETFRSPASSAPVPAWTPEKPVDPPERVDRDYFISNTNSLPISPGKRDADPVFRPSTPASGPTFGSKPDEGATRVFKAPVHEEAPPPSIPEGESQYTRIIRGPKREPAGSAASSASPAAPPASGGMQFPGMPKVQVAMPPMAMPHLQMPGATVSAPPVPHLQIPSVTVPPPKLPPGPKLPGLKKPGTWATYAPLIIILNLIFLAAVGLVLYFVFKP